MSIVFKGHKTPASSGKIQTKGTFASSPNKAQIDTLYALKDTINCNIKKGDILVEYDDGVKKHAFSVTQGIEKCSFTTEEQLALAAMMLPAGSPRPLFYLPIPITMSNKALGMIYKLSEEFEDQGTSFNYAETAIKEPTESIRECYKSRLSDHYGSKSVCGYTIAGLEVNPRYVGIIDNMLQQQHDYQTTEALYSYFFSNMYLDTATEHMLELTSMEWSFARVMQAAHVITHAKNYYNSTNHSATKILSRAEAILKSHTRMHLVYDQIDIEVGTRYHIMNREFWKNIGKECPTTESRRTSTAMKFFEKQRMASVASAVALTFQSAYEADYTESLKSFKSAFFANSAKDKKEKKDDVEQKSGAVPYEAKNHGRKRMFISTLFKSPGTSYNLWYASAENKLQVEPKVSMTDIDASSRGKIVDLKIGTKTLKLKNDFTFEQYTKGGRFNNEDFAF